MYKSGEPAVAVCMLLDGLWCMVVYGCDETDLTSHKD